MAVDLADEGVPARALDDVDRPVADDDVLPADRRRLRDDVQRGPERETEVQEVREHLPDRDRPVVHDVAERPDAAERAAFDHRHRLRMRLARVQEERLHVHAIEFADVEFPVDAA